MSVAQSEQSDPYLELVEIEFEKYCCARKLFIHLQPNWTVIIAGAAVAFLFIAYALTIAAENIVLALLCVSAGLILQIGIVIFEYWRIHRRMDALAEMRLRGKTFNF